MVVSEVKKIKMNLHTKNEEIMVEILNELFHCFSLNFIDACKKLYYIKLELNTEKGGCMSYTTPENAQRPRAVYDIHPDFRGI